MQAMGERFIRSIASSIKAAIDRVVVERGAGGGAVDIDGLRAQLIEELPTEVQCMAKLCEEIHGGNENAVKFLLEGKPAISTVGYSQTITNDFLAVQVLSDLFRTITEGIGTSEPMVQGVHLFMDEVEDILEAKSAEQIDFWASIRELVNRLPENFTLILAFSADAALLEAMMPMGIAERTTRPNLELLAMEVEEAKGFVAKQLSDFRPEGYEPPHGYYPFSEDAVNYVLEQTVVLVPRRIFRSLRQVLDRAIRREGLQAGEEITVEMTADIVTQIGI